MSILVVGSIAYDSVETPGGKVTDALGGSATFFSSSASLFCPVRMVGVVGTDFDFSRLRYLKNVDLSGVEVQEGKTFRWSGKYLEHFAARETLDTQLNVFESFSPKLPETFSETPFLFLANIHPDLQLNVLQKMKRPEYVVLDTMNFWIQGTPEALQAVLQKVDAVILNDEEVRDLTGVGNLITAARAVLKMGPKAIVVKKGEHGAFLLYDNDLFFLPAYPTEQVIDPTGAGDTFAGGFVGCLAREGKITWETLRRAVVYGSVTASFCVEAFSTDRFHSLQKSELENRFADFHDLTVF